MTNRKITAFDRIHGVLCDLDGVLYVGDDIIPGAGEAIAALKSAGIPCRFTTNTTTKSQATLYVKLQRLSLPIDCHEIISAPQAAVRYLRKHGRPSCYLCINDDLRQDFAEFPETADRPDVVIVGDIHDRWDYQTLNRLFRMLLDGAELIALHKGRYWHEADGLYLDIGAFVAGLEYATGTTATVIGKPNEAFFLEAVADMDMSPNEVIMVGDDIESDIGGAQQAGLSGILVKTGKYRRHLAVASAVKPDAIVGSIADIPALFADRR